MGLRLLELAGRINWQIGRLVSGLETCGMIEITDKIWIDEDELVFKFSRSGGPGGQNVNKVNTRVTVFFNVAGCESFSKAQKQRILKRLATRADKKDRIRIVSQRYRTQKANRKAAIGKLQELLQEALKKRAVRKETEVPYRVKQQRLEEKKRRSMLKRQRAGKNWFADFED